MDQIDLWSYLGFHEDGDLVDSNELSYVVSFSWLKDHIGSSVALRYRTESNLYYRAATVLKECEGSWQKGCRRIVLRLGKKEFAYLDEPLFFPLSSRMHLVYSL